MTISSAFITLGVMLILFFGLALILGFAEECKRTPNK